MLENTIMIHWATNKQSAVVISLHVAELQKSNWRNIEGTLIHTIILLTVHVCTCMDMWTIMYNNYTHYIYFINNTRPKLFSRTTYNTNYMYAIHQIYVEIRLNVREAFMNWSARCSMYMYSICNILFLSFFHFSPNYCIKQRS